MTLFRAGLSLSIIVFVLTSLTLSAFGLKFHGDTGQWLGLSFGIATLYALFTKVPSKYTACSETTTQA